MKVTSMNFLTIDTLTSLVDINTLPATPFKATVTVTTDTDGNPAQLADIATFNDSEQAERITCLEEPVTENDDGTLTYQAILSVRTLEDDDGWPVGSIIFATGGEQTAPRLPGWRVQRTFYRCVLGTPVGEAWENGAGSVVIDRKTQEAIKLNYTSKGLCDFDLNSEIIDEDEDTITVTCTMANCGCNISHAIR